MKYMASKWRVRLLLALLPMLLLSQTIRAEVVELKLPALSGKRHIYFARVLEESLRQAGHTARITFTEELPQPRVWAYLERGDISLFWALQTAERDTKYLPAGSDITGGMFGQRVLIVRPADLPAYAAVRTVDDFRALGKVGAFGSDWFDIDVWKLNNLRHTVFSGNWTTAFRGLTRPNTGVDYLSRSVLEIQDEMKAHGLGLAIEPTLLLSYDRDARFYLAPNQEKLQRLLDSALQRAQKSGLLKQLSKQYFKTVASSLKLDKRRGLALKTPEPSPTR